MSGPDLTAVPVLVYFAIGAVRFFKKMIFLVPVAVIYFVGMSRTSMPGSIVPPIVIRFSFHQ